MSDMKINVLIVDDDQHAIDALTLLLKSYSFVQVVGELNRSREALPFIRKNKVDLIFLDIEMDEINGLQLAKHIKGVYENIMIVFVTGHAGFALEGYESDPVDFLVKPIDVLRLEKVMDKVKNKEKLMAPKTDQQIGMKVSGGIRIVSVQDISYIEKKGRKITIVCEKDESFETTYSLKNLESIFLPYGFYRSHQSFIVPLNKIKAVYPHSYARSYSILLNDNTELPLSRNKFNELKQLLEDRGIAIY